VNSCLTSALLGVISVLPTHNSGVETTQTCGGRTCRSEKKHQLDTRETIISLKEATTMHDIIESAVFDECITAPLVVQFLGVRSLISFGATSTTNRILMKNEIERRKAVIVKTEYDVAERMAAERQSDELEMFINDILNSGPKDLLKRELRSL
jgi:hypothetical protein